ncbi:MAG: PP2C family protein-serine/threonine phosphatase, partial [Nocardioides sp.]
RQRIATYAEQQRARGVGPLQAGTTVVAALLAEHDGAPAWLLANLGDSRAYRVEGGSLEQVTVDHSVVQELVDTGLITQAAAAEHPERHVITRSLGGNQHSEPDLFVLPVAAAPRLVLCSDGISGMLDHEQMRQVLAASSDPDLAAEALLAAALDAGGRDNATVVVVDASPAPDDPAATADTTADLGLEQRLGALP